MKKHILLYLLPFIFGFGPFAFAQSPADQAIDHFTQAELKRKSKKYKEAVLEYDKAISMDGAGSYAYKFYFHKGQAHIHLREEEQAIKSFESAVQTNEKYVPAYLRLASLYLKRKDLDKAINAYHQAFKFEADQSKRVNYKLKVLKLLLKHNRYAEAETHIQDAKEVAPDNLDVLYFEARYHNSISKNYEQAAKSMEKGTSMLKSTTPKISARYYYELGRAYFHLEKYDESAQAFNKAKWGPFIKPIIKMSAPYHYSLAKSYFQIYEIEKSWEMVEKALKMRPDLSQAHDLKLDISHARTDRSVVIDHQEEAVKSENNEGIKAKKYADLAVMELEAGRYQDAARSADACLEIQPKNYQVRFVKALALFKGEKIDEAIHIVREELLTMTGVPMNDKAKFYFAMGLFYKAQKDNNEEAKKCFDSARYGTFAYAAERELEHLAHPDLAEDEEQEDVPIDERK